MATKLAKICSSSTRIFKKSLDLIVSITSADLSPEDIEGISNPEIELIRLNWFANEEIFKELFLSKTSTFVSDSYKTGRKKE